MSIRIGIAGVSGRMGRLLVEEVVEGERFTYRWASFTDEPSRVEITLSPIEEGTRVDIVESPLQTTMKASLALR